MMFDRFSYELRLMGKPVILTPLLIMVAGTLLIEILRLSLTKEIGLFSASLEMFLPLAAGVFVATLCGHDSAIELQLTLPTPYRRTVLYRVSLITGWTATIGFITYQLLDWLHLNKALLFLHSWNGSLPWLTAQLTWLAPLLWFVALGLCVTLLLRSRVASIALLGGIWVAENIMYGLLIGTSWLHPVYVFATTLTSPSALSTFWLANRYELLGTALVLLLIAWCQLHNTEMFLQKTGGDE